jgi:hypothetical protein
MPRALDDLFLKLAFGQRAAEVRARLGKGVAGPAPAATPAESAASSTRTPHERLIGSFCVKSFILGFRGVGVIFAAPITPTRSIGIEKRSWLSSLPA